MFLFWYFIFNLFLVILKVINFFLTNILQFNVELLYKKAFLYFSVFIKNIYWKTQEKGEVGFVSINKNKNKIEEDAEKSISIKNKINLRQNVEFKGLYKNMKPFKKELRQNIILSTLLYTIITKSKFFSKNILTLTTFIKLNFICSFKVNCLDNKGVVEKPNHYRNILSKNKKAYKKVFKKHSSVLFIYTRNKAQKAASYVKVVGNFQQDIKSKWVVKYSPSNMIKYITAPNQYTIMYLRKNKVFNKGRYSRNRQYYRTGVYWCLYINIIAVVGIYFWFYRFTMNFGYLWWLMFAFIASAVVPKMIKYKFYNPLTLVKSMYADYIWVVLVLHNVFLIITGNIAIKGVLLKLKKRYNLF